MAIRPQLIAPEEHERAATRLGCRGATVPGLPAGRFRGDMRFRRFSGRAQSLAVPPYRHPAVPHPAVVDVYYKDYVEKYPNILRAAWGFTVETATQGIRLVLSGVFDAYPGLKIILGHPGGALPFLLPRINMALVRAGAGPNWLPGRLPEHLW